MNISLSGERVSDSAPQVRRRKQSIRETKHSGAGRETAKKIVEKGAKLYIRVYRFNPMPRATADNTGRLAVSALALRHKI